MVCAISQYYIYSRHFMQTMLKIIGHKFKLQELYGVIIPDLCLLQSLEEIYNSIQGWPSITDCRASAYVDSHGFGNLL